MLFGIFYYGFRLNPPKFHMLYRKSFRFCRNNCLFLVLFTAFRSHFSDISIDLYISAADNLFLFFCIFVSSLSTNWGSWKPRRGNRSWSYAERMRRWDTLPEEEGVDQTWTPQILFITSTLITKFLPWLYKVTALRRQVRPVSGKVTRKVSLPEPLGEPSHRVIPGRQHPSALTTSNGARYYRVI